MANTRYQNAGAILIERAAKAGSTATTAKGAFRFLRALRHPLNDWRNGLVTVDQRAARRYHNTPTHSASMTYNPSNIVRSRAEYERTAHRVRYDRWMDSRAAEYLAAGRYLADRRRKPVALLDRDGYASFAANCCANRGLIPLDVADSMAADAVQAMCSAAAAEIEANWPFRKAESRWAGGEHSVRVSVAAGNSCGYASGGSDKVWSDNGKWSGRNSWASICPTLAALNLFPSLRTADGSIIVDAELLAPREYRVSWLRQSQGFDLATESGYLIRGYHVKAASLAQARRKAMQARRDALATVLRARDKARSRRVELAPLKSVYISVEDSLAAGNCKPMTDQFAAQVLREIGAVGPCAVRADVVLAMRDDLYTRKALRVAQSHAA